MALISVTWVEKQRYVGIDSTGHSVVLSGGNDIGIKPSDTLLIALGTCAAYDVVEIIGKQRIELQRLRVEVNGEQAATAPWAYQRIHLRFAAVAPALKPDQLTRAIDLSLNKYCSVRASLAAEIEVSFEAVLEEG